MKMWKLVLGFIAFAALAMFVIIKGGDNLEMGGESHSGDIHHEKPAEPAAPAAPATPATDAAAPIAPAAPADGQNAPAAETTSPTSQPSPAGTAK
ncbi:MAG TPA: hypothetical protein VFV28_04990 [Limnobacter sp.]|nr:hypothetical protein [Limnobacter sp.]